MHSIAAQVVTALKWQRKTLTLAESCTGGMVASAITAIPGASENFYGSFVTYTNDAKHNMIGVSSEILEQYGAVSFECAAAMAEGSRKTAKADYAASITGFAGPGGGTDILPVGSVYIAVANDEHIYVQKYKFSGEREQIRSQATIAALGLLLTLLKKGYIDEK